MADQRLIPNKSGLPEKSLPEKSPEETNALNNLIIPISSKWSLAKRQQSGLPEKSLPDCGTSLIRNIILMHRSSSNVGDWSYVLSVAC